MSRKEKLYLSYLEFEKKIYAWFVSERHRIVVLVLAVLFMWILTFIPYFNLLIDTSFIVLISTILSSILFKISPKKIILLALLLFFPSLIAVLLGDYDVAEAIGRYIYGFLFLGSILALLKNKN